MPVRFLSLWRHEIGHFHHLPEGRAWLAFRRKMAEIGGGGCKKPRVAGRRAPARYSLRLQLAIFGGEGSVLGVMFLEAAEFLQRVEKFLGIE
jgi:hypothetical protein